MAAESAWLDAGHDVDFHALAARSILNKSVSKRMHWMVWAINPYRGCEFGCRYCYARYTHEFMELHDPLAFERQIYIKQNAAWLLEQELRALQKRGFAHEEIALGTATDPWQPIERRAKVTRSLLAVLARYKDLKIGIVTKSSLIERDIDLLRQIDQRSRLVVHITITTPDAELARKLEPRAPRPDLRFQTVRRLRDAGIYVGILNSPLLPGITDTMQALETMARLSAESGAAFFAANPLFLKPCSRPTYMAFLAEHFPHLQAEYAARFDHADFASAPYRERMQAAVQQLCRRYGLLRRSSETLLVRPNDRKKPATEAETPAQARLFA